MDTLRAHRTTRSGATLRSAARRRRTGWCLALAAITATTVIGCDDGRGRLITHAQAATAGGWPAGRAAAATGLIADHGRGAVTLSLAIDHAFAMLDRGDPGATAYAGAVLDLALAVEASIPRAPEASEFLLRRIGRLAMAAAERAYQAGRIGEADSLVLAGPARWQSEPYFLRYTDHDALVAVIWAQTGRADAARARLESRPVLTGAAEEAQAMLRSHLGKSP